jgi:hypothetical protein
MRATLDTMKEMLSQSLFIPLRFHVICLFLITILLAGSVFAESPGSGPIRTPSWGATGHHIINLKAPMHLPASMSALRADSMFFYNHASDADSRKDTSGTSFFAETYRHYIDIDAYTNYQNLPHRLDSVIALYGTSFVRSNGTLPWAVVNMFDTVVAQLKRHDTTDALQSMADLGHYVGDAHQPLHCTDNYDGAQTGNSGIHSRYETGMVGAYQTSIIITKDSARYVSSPLDYIFRVIYHSNSLVDSILAADTYAKAQSGYTGSGSVPASYYTALWAKCGNFTKDQFQRATVALASLWYTAAVNAQIGGYISASCGANGTITPSGSVAVNIGNSQQFMFNPDSGYHVDSVVIDGMLVDSSYGYTFTNLNTSHTIYVSFVVNLSSYTISAVSGANGTIVPAGDVSVAFGVNQRFAFSPATGYHVSTVQVDGKKVDSLDGYTFYNVMAEHIISVHYAINTFAITAFSGAHGTIAPSGSVNVNYGASQRFAFSPSTGYHVDSVLVDGVKTDSTDGYTFNDVNSSHNIAVKYALNTYPITTVAGPGGSISPTPTVTVSYGGAVIFIVTPGPGYQIDSILVDEVYIGHRSPDTLENVVSAHTVRCVFSVTQITTMQIAVADKWNLISVPLRVSDFTKTAIYPDAVSDAFAYQGIYNPEAVLVNGVGYWMKFSGAHSVPITGYPMTTDTVSLSAGWNMIGVLSLPMAAADILTDTPGLTLSPFYGYGSGYFPADTLRPGSGYWVKANISGQIILSAFSTALSMNRIQMRQTNERPPSPPGQSISNELPQEFQLDQNYPNPFNPGTVIQYQLPADAYVSLKVYNTLGQEVAALVDGQQAAGYKTVQFENSSLPSGVYIYRLNAGTYSETKKMILIK